MPKSPDGKLASPRLCLKFHRDHLGSQANQKSRDSTYSVTNMSVSESCIDNPMFSPVDSPASSIDGDMYNPGLEHVTNFSGSRVKITIPEDENSNGSHDMKQNMNAPQMDGERKINSLTKEVCPDQGVCDNAKNNSNVSFPTFVCTSGDNQESKSVLKLSETLPFKPNSQFSLSQSVSQTEDYTHTTDVDTNTSETIPGVAVNAPVTNLVNSDCNSVTSSDINEANQAVSQSDVSSTEPSQNTLPSQVNSDDQFDVQSSSKVVTSENISQTNFSNELDATSGSHENVVNSSEASSTSTTCGNAKLDSHFTGSPKADSDSIKSSENAKPCSPNRTDRDSKDSRSSSPKVPPLKIIIPPKSTSSSTASENNDRLKLVVTNVKSALPYVINPYQDQGSEAEAAGEASSDNWCVNQVPGSASQAVTQSHNPSNSVDLNSNSPSSVSSGKVKKSGSVKGDTVSENVEMEVDEPSEMDNGNVKSTTDGDKFSDVNEDSGSYSSKCDLDGKREEKDKVEEPTQRVLRSAVRSQQQSSTESKPPKQRTADKSEKSEKTDKSSKYCISSLICQK